MNAREEDTPNAFEAMGVADLASGWTRAMADMVLRCSVALLYRLGRVFSSL